jgi:phosphatidylserine decarboxylase
MSVSSFAAEQIVRALPRARVSRAVGRLCDVALPSGVSRAVVRLYVHAYRVDLEECVSRPVPYRSFDDFFTRELRPGRRAICDNELEVASPADGTIEAIGPVDMDGTLWVKRQPYRVADLVGNETEARRYERGQFAVVYLSPRDYHRVHAPVAGNVISVRSMPGDLFPVNVIGKRHVPGLFGKNRRVSIVISTPRLGKVTVVMVGAMIVGRITVDAVPGHDVPHGVHGIDPPCPVSKGEQIGVFHLGSTAVVFVEPGVTARFRRTVGPVRLGQALSGAA